jgi:hypothetical protein
LRRAVAGPSLFYLPEEKMQPFANLEEIARIVSGFEDCSCAPGAFHHREHLAVAFWYCQHGTEEDAINRMRQNLQRFSAHHGLAGLYHETITVFWVKWVARFCAGADNGSQDVCARANEMLARSNPKSIQAYYRPETLAGARDYWREPDLRQFA